MHGLIVYNKISNMHFENRFKVQKHNLKVLERVENRGKCVKLNYNSFGG